MNWSHGHNSTIHNGISRIGFYTGGHAARFRDEDLADQWVEQSIRFIERHQRQPFFLYFAAHDIHVPRIPHERFQGQTALGPRGDAIVEPDWCVGELMRTLDRLQLAEKTLVVFCSDNGPVLDDGYQDGALTNNRDHRPAGPYSGGKYSVYEGGTRTPFITRWTGRIRPGVSPEIVCTIDLPASCAALAGQPLPADSCLDSVNVLAALLGMENGRGRDHLLQQDNGSSGTFGLRVGNWKLHRHTKKVARNVQVDRELANTAVPEHQLFNLDSDPAEQTNVLGDHPEIGQELMARLDDIIKQGRSRSLTSPTR